MSTSPISNPIQSIEDLKATISQESCVKKDPFIKLGSGSAPTLNYNIPQTAAFSTYGHVDVKLDPMVFKGNTKLVPDNNFWSIVEVADEPTIAARFAQNAQTQNNDDGLNANDILRGDMDVSASSLRNVSLNKAAPENSANIFDATNSLNEVQLAKLAKQGIRPMSYTTFGGKKKITYIKKPLNPNVKIFIIEEYKTVSYLGDYGAGKTVKTFSLLPGEKTTITVKTYKDISSSRTQAENIIDSFSQESADEVEKYTDQETSAAEAAGSSNSTTKEGKLSFSASGVIKKVIKLAGTASGSITNNKSTTANTTSNVKALSKALNKHVEKSNSNRVINVNTTTTESVKEGEETSVVRELVNINKSRVLNFVFRQLLQEYLTITYLADIKFVYCNGYPETTEIVSLEDLEALLENIIEPTELNNVLVELLKRYCMVNNYNDTQVQFIEKKTINFASCLGMSITENYYTRCKTGDTYTSGGLSINLPGPILNVDRMTLRTSSVVVDALLGQGEALDCYNMKLQDADAIKGYLNNLELVQQINALEAITDPKERADAYKKIFGNCCGTPQTQIIS